MERGALRVVVGVALATAVGGALASAQTSVDLDQGWSSAEVQKWYGISQGSRLAPEAWVRALEQPDGAGRFLDPVYIAGFRYLTDGAQGLPVGFAIDVRKDDKLSVTRLRWKDGQGKKEPWVGLTCAACHTAELRAGDKVMRVQGGPTLGDFQGLVEAFDSALVQTRDDAGKFKRFGDAVLSPSATEAQRAKLKGELNKLILYRQDVAKMSHTNPPWRYGYARLDAVGHILNKVAWVAKSDGPTANRADAPVSYPFLWNTSQQKQVQWNGIATNTPKTFPNGTVDISGLGRNVGEVIGVFADVKPSGGIAGYRSSVDVTNLNVIEQQLMRLKPPRWPREVMPIDASLLPRGRELFDRDCKSCHTPLRRDDLTTRTRPGSDKPLEEMTLIFPHPLEPNAPLIGTDIWMACNAATNRAATGALEGRKIKITGSEKFKDTASNSQMLASMVQGVILAKAGDVAKIYVDAIFGTNPAPAPPTPPATDLEVEPGDYANRRKRCEDFARTPQYRIVAYKGRPLTGVWATGPFLHNGSVPTLDDLLKPASQRPTKFFVGTRRFNAEKVGYEPDEAADNPLPFNVLDEGNKIIEGNSNRGHEYGTGLSAPDRKALVEYLKVIGEDG